jgi:hypothetical protein
MSELPGGDGREDRLPYGLGNGPADGFPNDVGGRFANGFADGLPEGVAQENGLAGRQVALVDLLDRLLSGGAVLTGDLVLSIADVDLVRVSLRAVIHSVTADEPAPW